MSEVQEQANQLYISGVLNAEAFETELRFADGRVVRVPTDLLAPSAAQQTPGNADRALIPVIEEQLKITKRIVETGKVHLHKVTETYDVQLDEPLAIAEWRIERIPKHEVIGETPATRQEGETTVYPVVEERLVLIKELVLVEEIRITPCVSERRDTQTVVLRREKMNVEREDLSLHNRQA